MSIYGHFRIWAWYWLQQRSPYMGIMGRPTSWSVKTSGISIYGHKGESYILVSESEWFQNSDLTVISEQWSGFDIMLSDVRLMSAMTDSDDGQKDRQELEVFRLNSDLRFQKIAGFLMHRPMLDISDRKPLTWLVALCSVEWFSSS